MDTEIEKTMGILTDLLHARAYDENYPTDIDLLEAINELREFVARVKAKDDEIEKLNMKTKTCEGCKWLVIGKYCTLPVGTCIRKSDDYFEPKDNA